MNKQTPVQIATFVTTLDVAIQDKSISSLIIPVKAPLITFNGSATQDVEHGSSSDLFMFAN